MLTSLDSIRPGALWPPKSEKKRLDRYRDNRRLFENEADLKWIEQAKRIQRMSDDRLISYHIALNYPKKISLKTADLLVSQPPEFEAGDVTDDLHSLLDRSSIRQKLFELLLDISMCGDGLFYVRRENGHAVIDITSPEFWFPVVSPYNIKTIEAHVLAYPLSVGDTDDKPTRIKMIIHESGRYTEREYLYKDGVLGRQIGADKVTKTGMDSPAIIHIPNTTSSRRLYGIDDYEDIDSIVCELEVRFAQIAKILDKHSSPTMQGPGSALKQDKNGDYYFPAGNYIENYDAETGTTAEVSYITWDAQLQANFEMIDRLIDQLYMQSEMGAAIFGDVAQNSADAPSGTALRRMMVSPLAKVARIREKLDAALKQAIRMASYLDGHPVRDISIVWHDGLPDDPKESAEIMQIRTGGKATISQWSAIKKLDGRSNKDVDDELDLIRSDDEIQTGGLGGAMLTSNEDDDI